MFAQLINAMLQIDQKNICSWMVLFFVLLSRAETPSSSSHLFMQNEDCLGDFIDATLRYEAHIYILSDLVIACGFLWIYEFSMLVQTSQNWWWWLEGAGRLISHDTSLVCNQQKLIFNVKITILFIAEIAVGLKWIDLEHGYCPGNRLTNRQANTRTDTKCHSNWYGFPYLGPSNSAYKRKGRLFGDANKKLFS